jgi:hypothetical protein
LKAEPRFAYDASMNVMFVEAKDVHLETKEDIRGFAEAGRAFWRSRCQRRKAYIVMCYDGFVLNIRENDYYAEQLAILLQECAITTVRYGGDTLQRSAARLRGMKTHQPSNLYASKEEALEVVNAIRAGTVTIAGTTS